MKLCKPKGLLCHPWEMERGHSAKGRESVKAWDRVAGADAAAGVVAKAKGDARAEEGEAEGEARAAALTKTRDPQQAPIQQIRPTEKKQTLKRKEFIMPFGDGTGPMGQGSMSGRGHGFCAGFNPGYVNRGPGVGGGFGRDTEAAGGITIGFRRPGCDSGLQPDVRRGGPNPST
jgi:hypothetical protein